MDTSPSPHDPRLVRGLVDQQQQQRNQQRHQLIHRAIRQHRADQLAGRYLRQHQEQRCFQHAQPRGHVAQLAGDEGNAIHRDERGPLHVELRRHEQVQDRRHQRDLHQPERDLHQRIAQRRQADRFAAKHDRLRARRNEREPAHVLCETQHAEGRDRGERQLKGAARFFEVQQQRQVDQPADAEHVRHRDQQHDGADLAQRQSFGCVHAIAQRAAADHCDADRAADRVCDDGRAERLPAQVAAASEPDCDSLVQADRCVHAGRAQQRRDNDRRRHGAQMLKDVVEVDRFDAVDQHPRGDGGNRQPQQRQKSFHVVLHPPGLQLPHELVRGTGRRLAARRRDDRAAGQGSRACRLPARRRA